jgi:ADP-ribosylation factor related protein 1
VSLATRHIWLLPPAAHSIATARAATTLYLISGMFGLLHGFYQYMFTKTAYNMIIVGLDGAGKTTLLEMSKTLLTAKPGLAPDKIVPTVGLNIGRVTRGSIEMLFWDLGGQATLRTIWPQYYSESSAVIWVLDSTDSSRFEDACLELAAVLRSPLLQGKPLLLLCNKQDMSTARVPSELEALFRPSVEGVAGGMLGVDGGGGLGERGAASGGGVNTGPTRKWRAHGICARTGDGIAEGLEWLAGVLR